MTFLLKWFLKPKITFFTLVRTIEIRSCGLRLSLLIFLLFPTLFFYFFFIGLFPTFLMCGKLKFLAFSCAANLASVVSNEVDQILKKKCFSLLHNHYGSTCLFHNIDPFNVSNLCVKRNHTASWDLNITVIKFAIKMNYNTSLNDIFLFLYSLKNKNFCG